MERDSIRSHAEAMVEEARVSHSNDATLRAAFVSSLHGRERTLARQRINADKSVTAKELMAYIVATVENKETEMDLVAFHSMEPRANEEDDAFGNRVLEEGTRVLTPRKYTTDQIDDQCKQIFVRAMPYEIRKLLAATVPRSLSQAIATVRNLRGLTRQQQQQEERVAAFHNNNNNNNNYNSRGRGGGGRGGRGQGRGTPYSRGGRGGRGGHQNHNNNHNRGGASGHGAGEDGQDNDGRGQGPEVRVFLCYRCGQPGHIRKECPQKPKNSNQAPEESQK